MPQSQKAIEEFLASLPVQALWGVGRVTGTTLQQAGFQTVADLQQAHPSTLERLLGKTLATHLQRLAIGDDSRNVETSSQIKSISREHTFLEDCCSPDCLRDVLKELSEDVGRQLRCHGYYASIGRLKLRWSDFQTITRQEQFSSPVCDDFSLRKMAVHLFNTERVSRSVRLIGFGVSGFCDSFQEQQTLFEPTIENRKKRERLCRTVDALRAKLGDQAFRRPSPPDS